MTTLTIGQVAKKSQVKIDTVRYYERRGIIPEPPRRNSGYRQYPEDAVTRIRFIRWAKDLGFTLKEIGVLLALRLDPRATSRDVRTRAKAKIADIDEKFRTLQRMKKALAGLEAACSGRASVSDCPILEALEEVSVERKTKGRSI